MLEAAYVGTKGTHLYSANVNLNNPNVAQVLAFQAAGQNPTVANINDPLGRKNANGGTYQVTLDSLVSPYFGYGTVSTILDASGNSIRHAGYVNFMRRQAPGLTLLANYTFGKSIDDGSDASPDKGTLTTSNVNGGQYTLGGSRALDRSVSPFDIKHQLNTTFIYDLPYGAGRRWGANAWAPVKFLLGGWSTTGIERFYSGYPATVTMADANFISGTLTHAARPNLVAGVPLVNPLYNSSCQTSASCQPYLNPAAFERPAYGQLGDAPRTFDAVRGPMQQTFDFSVQKSWNIGESGKRRVQFRVDMINAFNHPVFRAPINNGGGTDVFNATGGYPNFTVTKANVTTYYSSWAAANAAPSATSAQGIANINALYSQIASQENSAGVLPANFYSIAVPQGFALSNANSFNLLDPSLTGFKLNQLKTGYTSGFGTLSYANAVIPPRYIQLGLKIYF